MAPENTLPTDLTRQPGDHSLDVADLLRHCAEEMARYQRRQEYDPGHCYELFRRALVHRDEEAWTALYGQYHRLVRRHVTNAPGDADDLVNQAFQRFWRALPPDRFDDFATLASLLAYLRRCAQTVAIDARRAEERAQVRESALAQLQERVGTANWASSVEHLLDRITGEQIYEHVLGSLTHSQERLVFRASIEWNMKPRMIAERWPGLFDNAREVSRIKERFLRRLKRDRKLWALLGLDGGET